MRKLVIAALLVIGCGNAQAQVGPLLWQDDFNNLNNWLKVQGNGSWGWGNGELAFYKNENVDVSAITGEPGNNALRIIARQESGPGITDQWGNPLSYTSGKVVSKSFVSVKYGMIETRVLVPNLNLGGWPAFWMLGTATSSWPNCGEADLMEMGAAKAFRDLHDTHNGGNGLDNSTVNQLTGANSMRFTVVDNCVEHDLYVNPFLLSPDSDEFRQPFYLLANLAIGGTYTDAYRLGAPASGAPISMPLPATMLMDYVRVYQWNGQGEVTLGPPTAQLGRFGLFTDTTPTTTGLVTGVSSDVYAWESTLVPGTIPPFEGSNGLTWRTNAKGWFGAGVMSRQAVNLFALGDGSLKFRIKIPANVTFKIGVIDSWGNQFLCPAPRQCHQVRSGAGWRVGPGLDPGERTAWPGHRPAHAELRVRHPGGKRHRV